MTFRDLVSTAAGNLWRMKLRTVLTVSGVMIAIAAFIAMLSFGVGMQIQAAEQYEKLGLLSMINVYPGRSDTTDNVPLDHDALSRLAGIPGVELVYPLEPYKVEVSYGDSTFKTTAQALPSEAMNTKLYSNLTAGKLVASDSTKEVILFERMLEKLGISPVDSVIGQTLIVSIEVSSVDSGIAEIFGVAPETIRKVSKSFDPDSLRSATYWGTVVREEFSGAIGRFVSGFLDNRKVISDTLTIAGILNSDRRGRIDRGNLIIPLTTARLFNSSGFSGDPTQLLSAVQSGNLFTPDEDSTAVTFKQATVKMEVNAVYEPIKDSIEAAGFRAFSYAERFKEMRELFRYFNMALGLVGIIALMTASLGIVNTMIMSINERRREIGVWMSLGADMWEIRKLFLIESALIGFMGAIGGIIAGWTISRIASFVAQKFMENEGVTPIDLFAVPLWLMLTAISFGIVVALLAGYYPANRAARINPVEALRNE